MMEKESRIEEIRRQIEKVDEMRPIEQKKEVGLGFLDKEDREILEEAGPKLREIIKEAEKDKKPFKTYIYLTTGARLLSHFVRGLTEDLTEREKPEVRYVQVTAGAGKGEKKLIFERIAEAVKSTEPPYLIVDDYVTGRHRTFDIMKQGFKKSGVRKDDITFFAFIAESKNLDEEREMPPEFYDKLGIHIGTRDKFGSSAGFGFDEDLPELKGVRKKSESKYEEVLQERYYSALRSIRKSLYSIGKDVAEKYK